MANLFVAGGTSELGNRVVAKLIRDIPGASITCMVRGTSAAESVKYLQQLGIKICYGDVTDSNSLKSYLDESTVYLDMTHPKYYHVSMDAVKASGVKRAFFVTTTGIFSRYNHASEIYKIGEACIRESGIAFTILRPSMIYGTERDRNMTKLLRYLSQWPVFPVFGSGECLMQPVYVQDLADGIATAIINSDLTVNKEYNLCGPFALTYTELLKTAAVALESKVIFMHIPYQLALAVAAVGEKIPGFPIRKEQVMRLMEDKSFDISLAQEELGYSPMTFAEGIRLEIQQLKEVKIL